MDALTPSSSHRTHTANCTARELHFDAAGVRAAASEHTGDNTARLEAAALILLLDNCNGRARLHTAAIAAGIGAARVAAAAGVAVA
jgi:hypothetical protein